MSLKLGKKMTVKLVYSVNYWLKNSEGVVIDTSEGGVPMVFIQGSKNTIQGIQDAVVGRSVGDKIEAIIPPELAYGQHDPELTSVVSRSVFDGVEQVSVGMKFQTNTGGEAKVVQVVDVKGEDVVIDANHPLAGLTLTFELEVVKVREATEHELRSETLTNA